MSPSDLSFWSASDPLQGLNVGLARMVRATLQVSWPALMHKSVANYVLADAIAAGLPPRLVKLYADNSRVLFLYAAAPDNNGVGQVLHIYRPGESRYQGGLQAIRFWYAATVTMLQRVQQAEGSGAKVTEKMGEDAVKAAAALSHFTADLANPMHTTKDEALHSGYERWLGQVFLAREATSGPLAGIFRRLDGEIGQYVCRERTALADLDAVSRYTADCLVGGSHAEVGALREAWSGRRRHVEPLITLSARMFGLGATATADLWATAWRQAQNSLPLQQLRLGSVASYDGYLRQLTAHAQKGMALGWW